MLNLDNQFWNDINQVSKLNYSQIQEKLCSYSKYKEKYYNLNKLNLYSNETFLFLMQEALKNNDIYLIINLFKSIKKNKNYHLNNSSYNIDIILNNICKYAIGKEILIFNFIDFLGKDILNKNYLIRKIYVNCRDLLLICNKNYDIKRFQKKFYEKLNLNYDELIIENTQLKVSNFLLNYKNYLNNEFFEDIYYHNYIEKENFIENNLNDNIILGFFLKNEFIEYLFEDEYLLQKICFSDIYFIEKTLNNGFKQGLELMHEFTDYNIESFFNELNKKFPQICKNIIISFFDNKIDKIYFDYYFIEINNKALNKCLTENFQSIKNNLITNEIKENNLLNIKEIDKYLSKLKNI